MKLEKRKLKRYQSTIDIIAINGLNNKLKSKAQEIASPTSPGIIAPKFNVKLYQEAALLPEKKSIIPKRPAPVRFMSSHTLKMGSLKKVSVRAEHERKVKSPLKIIRGASSLSIKASAGEYENTPGQNLLSMRLKDSSHHLIVDKSLFINK